MKLKYALLGLIVLLQVSLTQTATAQNLSGSESLTVWERNSLLIFAIVSILFLVWISSLFIAKDTQEGDINSFRGATNYYKQRLKSVRYSLIFRLSLFAIFLLSIGLTFEFNPFSDFSITVINSEQTVFSVLVYVLFYMVLISFIFSPILYRIRRNSQDEEF